MEGVFMAVQTHSGRILQFTRFLVVLGMTLTFATLAGTANAANLTLAWDANSEPDLVGYLVYCGESSGHYSITKEVTSDNPGETPPTACEFTGLEEGATYYFSAIAFSDGGQSDFSEEISYTVPTAQVDPRTTDDDDDGYSENQGDCNDNNAAVNPGATDLCGDGIDQDCSGGDLACPDLMKDSDNDGLTDNEEEIYHTDPMKPDSDGDGVSDGEEVAGGFDPNDPTSKPAYGLVQEAEEIALPVDSVFKKGSDPIASNGMYVYVPNGEGTRFDGPIENEKIVYKFNIVEEGTYRIKGSVHAANGSDDSFWVKVNESQAGAYLWDVMQNTGYQQDYVNDRNGADPIEVTLHAGLNTVSVYLREDGTRLDKIEMELVKAASTAMDSDGDGFTVSAGDCNDNSASVFPGAIEICSDGIDQNCDGFDIDCKDIDGDGDGFSENQGDCDDKNPGVFTGATDTCGDGIDQDCDGRDSICVDYTTDTDNDGLTDYEEETYHHRSNEA